MAVAEGMVGVRLAGDVTSPLEDGLFALWSRPDDAVVALVAALAVVVVGLAAAAVGAELLTCLRRRPRPSRPRRRSLGASGVASASAIPGVLAGTSGPVGAILAPVTTDEVAHAYTPTAAGQTVAPLIEKLQFVPTTHVVMPGESLWSLAEAAIASTGAGPDVEAVGSCWVRLVEMNGLRLASGDPDVVWPGEVVDVPPC